MLTHRNTIILFSLLFLGLVALNFLYSIHIIWFIITGVVFSLVEFYGAAYIQSNFHVKATCGIDTNEKVVAITFDDGPIPMKTEKVLSVLRKFDVKASFFCIGNRIKGNDEILSKIDKEGHVIGNHSYSHGNMFDMKNTKEMVKDLEEGNKEIKRVIGKTPLFFRPPYGVTTPSLAKACKNLNFNVIGWNVRSLDTALKNKQEIVGRVKSRIRPGSIILLHDSVDGIDVVLEELLTYLQSNDYKVVALTNLINKEAYA